MNATRSSSEPSSADYNAQVVDIRRCHADLRVMRVAPDAGLPKITAGQYTVLGLGNWEPRVDGSQPEPAATAPKLIKRAYSISCPILNDQDRLSRVSELPWLEFYISLVRQAEASPPALTPRLFGLESGQRLFLGDQVHGRYTLEEVGPDDHVLFLATGTGEAPHNAMIAELLARQHRGHILSAVCVRYHRDLAYLSVHRRLEDRFAQYRYLTLTTREAKNLDPQDPDYVGRRYLQDYFESGDLEADAGILLSPECSHVFLCGSPQMIGMPQRTHVPAERFPHRGGMVELLEDRGFMIDLPHEPGNIHFESYW